MAAVQPLRVSPEPRDVDHIVMLNGLSWNDYEAVLRMRGDRSAPRICFCEGTLEIMSPSRYHEADKTKLARLLETWSALAGIPIEGYGSETQK